MSAHSQNTSLWKKKWLVARQQQTAQQKEVNMKTVKPTNPQQPIPEHRFPIDQHFIQWLCCTHRLPVIRQTTLGVPTHKGAQMFTHSNGASTHSDSIQHRQCTNRIPPYYNYYFCSIWNVYYARYASFLYVWNTRMTLCISIMCSMQLHWSHNASGVTSFLH